MVELMAILVRSCSTASPTLPPTILSGIENPLMLPKPDESAVLDSVRSSFPTLHIYFISLYPNHGFPFLFKQAFLAQVLRDGVQLVMTADILKHWSFENKIRSREFLSVVIDGIKKVEHILYRYYFSVLLELLELEDSLQTWRVDNSMVNLLKIIKTELRSKEPVVACIKYTKKLAKKNDKVKQWVNKTRSATVDVLEHHPLLLEPDRPTHGHHRGGNPATSFLQKTRGIAGHK